MYKNQLQELAQRSCFNLPSYACIKEGPNHAPRFKASVNFNGEIFESQTYCNTLRQAEHSAAEVALNVLSSRGPSRSLTARVLDETGIYKNLLQETAHRAGLRLPVYTTVRSGPGHVPTFTCSVEIAGMSFTGESAKTKKQAEKNAAIAAWSALNRMPATLELLTSSKADTKEDQVRKRDQIPSKRYFLGGPCGSSSSSSPSLSPSSSHIDIERLKLMNLIMDLGQEGLSLQKHNNFASLVPPPPPRTTSKILPPPNRPIPVQVTRSSHHANTIVEDHIWDEEEWLGITKKSPISSTGDHKQVPESSNTNSTRHAYKAISSTHKPCHVFSKAYLHPHKIAPAVQIRSVIPVCSAPPSPRPTTTTTIGSSTTSPPPKSHVSDKPDITQRFTLLGSEDGDEQHINTT